MNWLFRVIRYFSLFQLIYCNDDYQSNQFKTTPHSNSHRIFKRSNAQRFHSNENPLGNFDIRRNTIIRTQDSRAMGAEFLHEMEQPSNDACLMWCLEKPHCNVAVYEEKGNHSCYLFNCGSLSNFLCNFTSYTSYVSSILRGNRHQFDLKQWPSQVKHENELTSLRKPVPHQAEPPAEPKEQPTVVPSPVPPRETFLTETRSHPQELIEDQSPSNSWTPEPACLHYQFQCRSNKECIAIYNVCDGIPQCPDGSDEGKYLQCPPSDESSKTTLPSTMAPTPPPPPPPTQTIPTTEAPPRPPPTMPAAPEKAPSNSMPSYQGNRPGPDDMSMVDDGGGSLYSLQDPSKMESVWTQYQQQQQALANGQQDDYVAPIRENKPSHNLYPPQHILFSNKHSSFHPASSVNYRPSLYQGISNNNNNNNNHQWGNDYYNNENFDPPKGPPPEIDYNGGYDSGYRGHGSNYNGNTNFHMGPLKVGPHVPQPFDHYRPSSPYWAADEQMLSKSGYSKSEELPLVPEITHQQVNSHMSHYSGEPMLSNQAYPQPPPQQQQLLPHSKPYGLPKKPQYVLSPESSQMYLPRRPPFESDMKMRRPVVQPQVQNDGSQEDSIYDPQADVPAGGMVDTEVQHIHHPMEPVPITLRTTTTTMAPSTPSSTSTTMSTTASTTKKPFHKGPAPHALIHSVSHSHISGVSAESGMSISELQQASRVHSHESNGAVLALTLGLSITAILMVLVACRLRNLRRRLSRRGGRSSLAHDADYLVNGMYL